MINTTDAFERNDEGYLVHPTLYKLDSTGRLRTWCMQRDGSRYRTLAGLADGKQAVSGWTQARAASCDTDEEQAIFEVRAQYKHQLDREYHDSPDTVSQPKMIEPMLAKTYDKWPGECYAQPKLDGIRCIMTVEGMFTRQGQPILAVPHLHAAAAQLFVDNPDLILDGELYNHDLRDDFGEISSIVRKKKPTAEQLEKAERIMQYHVYDIVDDSMTFTQRVNFLKNLTLPGWFQVVPTHRVHSAEYADELYEQFVSKGYEGGIYRLDKPYQLGRRSKYLLKRKDFETAEFRVLDIQEGNGNWAGAAKRVLLENDNGQPFGAGIRGNYSKLVNLLADWQAREDWRTEGKFVATVRFFGRSPDDQVPRFGVVIDLHPKGRKD